MTAAILTQSQLKEALDYNQETGIFTRLISVRGTNSKVGDVAGWVEKTTGYRRIMINNKTYRAHRVAWFYVHGIWPKDQIDHDDHDRDNNRIANLQEATNQENCKNQSIPKNNSSGVVGVSWSNSRGRWASKQRAKNKKVNLCR